LGVIETVTWANINTQFPNATAYRFVIAKVAQRYAVNSPQYGNPAPHVTQTIKPTLRRVFAFGSDVVLYSVFHSRL
jgi:hypothetical protein